MLSWLRAGWFLLASLLFPATAAQPRSISLDGDWAFRADAAAPLDLYRPEVSLAGWSRIRVPGNWFLQGHDYNGAAWYARDVQVEPLPANALALLEFDGVDYWADAWVNGRHVGRHEGYFERFAFEVGAALKPGRNRIVVRVDAPTETPGTAWSLRKRQVKGVLNHHDTRPGGAWTMRGQEAGSGGIWQSLRLRILPGTALQTVQVSPTLLDEGQRARLQLRLALQSRGSTPLRLDWRLLPDNFTGAALAGRQSLAAVAAGSSERQFAIEVARPELWWPRPLGEPRLYRLELSLRDAGGRLLDRQSLRLGIRELAHDAATGFWSVNGQRLFLKGSNYIGSHWLSELDAERARGDLQLMQDAHVNAVRVHAHVASPAFYDAADAAGMLVWQDFPLQWGYTDEPGFEAEARRQALAMVAQLYNHPSIIAWSLHNEPPWDSAWMQYLYDDYQPEQNRMLDAALLAAVRPADPTRYTHAYSSSSEHPWYGWYSATWAKYLEPTTQPLVTEFGAQALPQLSTLRQFIPEAALWPKSDRDWRLWEFHNFQRKETFDIVKVARGDSIEQLIANTQAYQSRVIEAAAESYRRQKYQPVGAIFQFMFVEAWPSMNWAVVDYLRQPKPGYRALAQAYQPVLPSMAWPRDRYAVGDTLALPVTVVSDLRRPIRAAELLVEMTAASAPDTVLQAERWPLAVEADGVSATRLCRLRFEQAGDYRVRARVIEDGQELGRQEHGLEVR